MWVLAVVPHRLIVVHLDHAQGTDDGWPVPGLWFIGVRTGMAPDVIDGGAEIFLRQRVVNDHITKLCNMVVPLGWTLGIVPLNADGVDHGSFSTHWSIIRPPCI